MINLSGFVGVSVCLLIVFPSCSQRKAKAGDREFYSAIEYNDFIVDQQNQVIQKMVSLTNSYDEGTPAEVKMNFNNLVKQAEQCSANIDQLSDFDGDSTLKREARNLFGFYNRIFHNEYKKMVDIFLKGPNASDSDIVELNTIVQDVRKKEDSLNQKLGNVQVAFARKFEFEFSDVTDSSQALELAK
jgi:hypothetical protein